MRPPFLRIWQRHAELLIAFPVSLALEFSRSRWGGRPEFPSKGAEPGFSAEQTYSQSY